ncbi:MAG: HAD hydrolase-like protein [Candidatus Giovannonibacteria bacterium]|nr:HAD hydrolase-like protein [Candidatus Giovannonibacteria bacterium]
MPNKFFEELETPWQGAVIFLDIDGTLRPDGVGEMSPEVLNKLAELEAKNEVHLTSNKGNKARKPSRKAAEGIDLKGKKTVVIGDKFLTDYLFARNIGAEFVMVKRKISGKESLFVKITYFIDDIISNLWIRKNI